MPYRRFFICIMLCVFAVASCGGGGLYGKYKRSKIAQRWADAEASWYTFDGQKVRVDTLPEDGQVHQIRVRHYQTAYVDKWKNQRTSVTAEIARKVMNNTCGGSYFVISDKPTIDLFGPEYRYAVTEENGVREYTFKCSVHRDNQEPLEAIYKKWKDADNYWLTEGDYKIRYHVIPVENELHQIRLRMLRTGTHLSEDGRKSVLGKAARRVMKAACGGLDNSYMIYFDRPTADVVYAPPHYNIIENIGVREYGFRCFNGI